MTMMGMPVTIRLLDFSSDKAASLRECAPESVTFDCDRPDFLLANPEILKQQAHAIAEVSSLGPVSVLYPMVRDADHFAGLKKAFEDAVEGVDISHVDHGAMFELPSACEDAERLMELVDFGSVGTNDLVHLLFGTDREENGSTALVEYSDRPELWGILDHVASEARRLSRPLTICGEMGSRLKYFKRFSELGIFRVSVDIPIVSKMRTALKVPPSEGEEYEEGVGDHVERYTR
jgi:phosphoenolpyruvate-protein kinase (PTS system EI component)